MKKIIYVILCTVVIIWCFASMYESCINPVDPYNFTVEERIRYESRIF